MVGPFFFLGVCSLREAVKEGRAGEKDSGKNFRGFFLRLTLQGDEGCGVVHPEKERVLIVGLQVQAGGSSDFDNNRNCNEGTIANFYSPMLVKVLFGNKSK